MAKSSLSDDERANLVAYLDGELSGQARSAVEVRLNTDLRLRAEAETLRRTWSLLDHLPCAEPSGEFSQKTLERVSALRPASARWKLRLRCAPWALGISWAAAVFVAGVVGFAGARAIRSRPPATAINVDEHLLRDIRVIENERLYEPVLSFHFLQELANPDDLDLFGTDSSPQ